MIPRFTVIIMLISAVSCGGGGTEGQSKDACEGDCLEVWGEDLKGDESKDEILADAPADTGCEVDECEAASLCPGGFGCECNFNTDCLSGWCVIVDDETNKRLCSEVCLETCPLPDWGCQQVGFIGTDPLFVCVPYIDPLCKKKCLNDTDCGVGNMCLDIGGKKFCSQDCSENKGCPEKYNCTPIFNEEMVKLGEQCLPKSGSCICDETVDYMTDVNNCGECEKKCEFPNGIPECSAGTCIMIGCEEGWINLDGKDENGCEYECTYQGPDDKPDPLFIDFNCDGIDGKISDAVFVAKDGTDEDNNIGNMNFPFKTISKGIDFASKSEPKKSVYVSNGVYNEQVKMVDGVSIYGGYNRELKWKRDTKKYESIIRWGVTEGLAIRAVVVKEITSPTVLDGFVIESLNAYTPSGSSYAVYIYHTTDAFTLSNNVISSGNGANGLDGIFGIPGQHGANGEPGYDGGTSQCNPGNGYPSTGGGKGGENICQTDASGGNGGAAGWGSSDCNIISDTGCAALGWGGCDDPFPGKSGSASPGGSSGGSGGGYESNGSPGQNGKVGADGINGMGGIAGGYIDINGMFNSYNGQDGTDGTDGTGGGGGGGGGGSDNGLIELASFGGAGGGGGAGGCGGTGGKGGSGGGSSFAIFVLDATPKITGNIINYGNGGNGGNGGLGGKGGEAGNGGNGGAKFKNGGKGGDGGSGGKGGNGGHGGGGSGGSSFGIYIAGDALPTCSDNSFEKIGVPGAGGIGGDPSTGNKGATGLSGNLNKTTSTCK